MKRILVSACLAGCKCRFDGSDAFTSTMNQLLADHEIITVCPELLAGLPIPRPPVEIVDGKALAADGEDFTESFVRGAEKVVEIAKSASVTMAILKSGSPSCGSDLVYDGSFTGHQVPGEGILAKMLREAGINVFSEHTFK